jgi:heme exporter protein B
MNQSQAFMAVFQREARLAWAGGGGAALPAGFFIGIATLVAFGLGAALDLAPKVAPAILWAGLSLSVLLSLDRLFEADLEAGAIEIFHLSPLPLDLTITAKITGLSLGVGAPLAAAGAAAGLLLGLPAETLFWIALELLIGAIALTSLGAIAAALAAGLRRSGLLIALLTLPLFAPVTIFGAAASGSAHLGFAAPGASLLLAITILAAIFAPKAAGAALRLALE